MARLRLQRLPGNVYHLFLNLTNRHVHAQLVDREAGHIVLAAHSTEQVVREKMGVISDGPGRYATGSVAAAGEIGRLFAERARNAGVEKVYWKRPGRYHGKIKAFIDAVREAGIMTHAPPSSEMPRAPKHIPGVPGT